MDLGGSWRQVSQMWTQAVQVEVLDYRNTDRRAVVRGKRAEKIAKEVQSGGCALRSVVHHDAGGDLPF